MDFDQIERLIKSGKRAEAKKILDDLLAKSKTEPNEIRVSDGQVTHYRKGKRVEQDADGNWHPYKKK